VDETRKNEKEHILKAIEYLDEAAHQVMKASNEIRTEYLKTKNKRYDYISTLMSSANNIIAIIKDMLYGDLYSEW